MKKWLALLLIFLFVSTTSYAANVVWYTKSLDASPSGTDTMMTWDGVATQTATLTSILALSAGYTNLTQFVDQTIWSMFYSNALGDVTELGFGTSGYVLQSNGATAAPTWVAQTGGMSAATYDPATIAEQLVGLVATQTLTNKTLTSPIISTISNTGVVTLPTATDTLVGRATTDTLTNKSIDGSTNTLSNVNLASQVTGDLDVTNLNGGTSAGATTYWRGDGTWVTPAGSSPMTTKGDIYAYDTGDARLAVGTDGYVLCADSVEVTGLKWCSSLAVDIILEDAAPIAAGQITYDSTTNTLELYSSVAVHTFGEEVATGTSALGTSAITSATCATVVTTAATGTATTDVINWGFNGDPTAVTGYVPLTTGMLTIIAYPTANNVNFKVCNNTAASITPGAITLNWRVN